MLAAAWTAFEWLRGWIFTGYPWNLIGYSWAFSDAMNQLAALHVCSRGFLNQKADRDWAVWVDLAISNFLDLAKSALSS